jgi:carbonic anhydrase/acetyltransferase-like protein (isoleucine patch superfamily)
VISAYDGKAPRLDPTAFVVESATVIGDVVIGAESSIWFGAVVHGCAIEDGVLVGMGAIVLDGAIVGAESLVGAGALVPPGSRIPPRSLVLGSPGKVVRPVSDAELERLRSSAANYVGYAQRYRAEGVR